MTGKDKIWREFKQITMELENLGYLNMMGLDARHMTMDLVERNAKRETRLTDKFADDFADAIDELLSKDESLNEKPRKLMGAALALFITKRLGPISFEEGDKRFVYLSAALNMDRLAEGWKKEKSRKVEKRKTKFPVVHNI